MSRATVLSPASAQTEAVSCVRRPMPDRAQQRLQQCRLQSCQLAKLRQERYDRLCQTHDAHSHGGAGGQRQQERQYAVPLFQDQPEQHGDQPSPATCSSVSI